MGDRAAEPALAPQAELARNRPRAIERARRSRAVASRERDLAALAETEPLVGAVADLAKDRLGLLDPPFRVLRVAFAPRERGRVEPDEAFAELVRRVPTHRKRFVELRPKRFGCRSCEGEPVTTQTLDWYDERSLATRAYAARYGIRRPDALDLVAERSLCESDVLARAMRSHEADG